MKQIANIVFLFFLHYQSISNRGNLALTIVLFLTATTLFSQISPAIVVIYILGMIFLTFVCPFWLIWIQRYKK